VGGVGLGGQTIEAEVPRPLDAAGLVLVGLADVDQLDLAALQEIGHPLGGELGGRVVEDGHTSQAICA
jgi:hypothetical protein